MLSRWKDFPVLEVPRPIVLLDLPVHLGAGGFVDSDAKTAFGYGAIEATVDLPKGLRGLITGGHQRRPAPGTVIITSVRPCEEIFRCDRGPRLLPAYQLHVTGLKDLCTVLDPSLELWWPRSADEPGHRYTYTANIDKDDRTLRFPAFGGYFTEFHHAEFTEYPTCVVGRAVTSEKDVPPSTMVPAVAVNAMVTGRLQSPLNGRVLVHESGEPIAVLPATEDGT